MLNALNIMRLQTPQSAVLSAVIFNALIIVALIPLALRGVGYTADERRISAAAESAGVWIWRTGGSVHRHQADRHVDHRHQAGLRKGW